MIEVLFFPLSFSIDPPVVIVEIWNWFLSLLHILLSYVAWFCLYSIIFWCNTWGIYISILRLSCCTDPLSRLMVSMLLFMVIDFFWVEHHVQNVYWKILDPSWTCKLLFGLLCLLWTTPIPTNYLFMYLSFRNPYAVINMMGRWC